MKRDYFKNIIEGTMWTGNVDFCKVIFLRDNLEMKHGHETHENISEKHFGNEM